MGAAVLAIPTIIAAGMQVFGTVKGAGDRADASRQEGALRNAQADELMAREAINEQNMAKQGHIAELQAGAGFNGLEGGNIGEILNVQNVTRQNIANQQRDAAFKAMMLRQGANIDTKLAGDLGTAADISAAGTILGTGTQLAGKFIDFGGSSNLPQAPAITGSAQASASDYRGKTANYARPY